MRRRMLFKKQGGILPEEYQQVAYIQSTGTQCIDTGVKVTPNLNISVLVKVIDDAEDSTGTIFGGGVSHDNNYIGCAYFRTTSDFRYHSQRKLFRWSYTDFVNVSIENKVAKIDEEVITTFNTSPQSDYTIYLFCYNRGGDKDEFVHCQLKEAVIGNKHLIPCYRKSDNEIGLYDIVGGQFYTNAGTGTFLKGEDV